MGQIARYAVVVGGIDSNNSWNSVAHSAVVTGVDGEDVLVPAKFDMFSSYLILNSLKSYAAHGDDDLGGFMLAFEKDVHIALVRAIRPEMADRPRVPYISNFSLQYDILKMLTPRDPGLAWYVLFAASIFMNLAMAIVAGLFAGRIRDEFSTAAALGVVALLILSPRFGVMAGHVYWAGFLVWLPFTFMWLAYPRLRHGRRWLAGLGAIAFLVGLKCLTGYEFVTNVAIGAAVPVVYYELKDVVKIDRSVLVPLMGRVISVGIASVVGFAAAAAMHVAKASAYFGSVHDGWQALILPMQYSTAAETSIRAMPVSPASIAGMISSYAQQSIVLIFSLEAIVLVLVAISYIASVKARTVRPGESCDPNWPKTRAFGLAALLASIGSISWMLAVKHMMAHLHINWLCFFAFMLPMLVPFTIYAVETYLLGRVPERQPAPAAGA